MRFILYKIGAGPPSIDLAADRLPAVGGGPRSEPREHEVLDEARDDVAPEPHGQGGVELAQPGLDEAGDGPEGTKKISDGEGTYRLPVRSERGFRSPCLRKAKASSTGAVAYEYGAEITTRKPSARMCATDSRQVW